jgi:hypothetical protein
VCVMRGGANLMFAHPKQTLSRLDLLRKSKNGYSHRADTGVCPYKKRVA